MSTAAVSSGSLFDQLQTYFQGRDADLKQLGKDLANGDLSGAQQEYAAIVNLGQNGPLANGNEFAVAQRQQDFNAIGQALQSGDLSGAQQAFAELKSTVAQSAQPSSPVILNPATGTTASSGSSSSSSDGGSEIVINLGAMTPGEQVDINLSGSSSGGEQVTIGVSGQQGQSPEQITLNLNPNSNQQIILNLLNGTAGTSSSSSSSSSTGLSVSA